MEALIYLLLVFFVFAVWQESVLIGLFALAVVLWGWFGIKLLLSTKKN